MRVRGISAMSPQALFLAYDDGVVWSFFFVVGLSRPLVILFLPVLVLFYQEKQQCDVSCRKTNHGWDLSRMPPTPPVGNAPPVPLLLARRPPKIQTDPIPYFFFSSSVFPHHFYSFSCGINYCSPFSGSSSSIIFRLPPPPPSRVQGRDIIGVAQTGSGKTLAFVWPSLVHLMDQREIVRGKEGPIVVILAPTRELAGQIYAEANKFAKRLVLVLAGTRVCSPAFAGGLQPWERSKGYLGLGGDARVCVRVSRTGVELSIRLTNEKYAFSSPPPRQPACTFVCVCVFWLLRTSRAFAWRRTRPKKARLPRSHGPSAMWS